MKLRRLPMKVRYINIENALRKMEEIHQQVAPYDEFEKKLYNDVMEVGGLLVDAYGAIGIPKKEMEGDLRQLLDIYFEAAEQFKRKQE